MGEEQCKLIEEDLKKMLFHSANVKEKLPKEQMSRLKDSYVGSRFFPEDNEEWPALGTDSSIPKMHFVSKKETKGMKRVKLTSNQSYFNDELCNQYGKERPFQGTKNYSHRHRKVSQEHCGFKHSDKESRRAGVQKGDDPAANDSGRYSGWEGASFGKKQYSNSSMKTKPKARQLRPEEHGSNRNYYQTQLVLNGNIEDLQDSGQHSLKSFLFHRDRTKSREVIQLTSNQMISKDTKPFRDKNKKEVDELKVDHKNASSGSAVEIGCKMKKKSDFSKVKISETASSSNLDIKESYQISVNDLENEDLAQMKQQKEKKKKKKKKKVSTEKEGKKDRTKDNSFCENSDVNLSSTETYNKPSNMMHQRKRDAPDDSSLREEIQELLNKSRGSGEDPTMAPFSPDVIECLKKDYVILKKHKTANFKKPHFYCQICMMSCPDLSGVQKHITMLNHKEKKQLEDFEETLKNVPSPLPIQVEAISELLIQVSEEYGLSMKDIKHRQNITNEIDKLVKTSLPGCGVQLVGSSRSGFGVKTSEVDIVLQVPSDGSPSDMLNATYELLSKDENFVDVTCEFKEKIPRICLTEKQTLQKCYISLSSGSVCSITKLLEDYISIDPRGRILGTCFRYWAKLCEIDQQKKGTLPSFCFSLMVIYFLQQHKPPILPVLHELAGNPDGDVHLDPSEISEKWKCQNTESVGELWIHLLKYYSVTYRCGIDVVSIRNSKVITCKDKNWGTKFLAIEDPYSRRNLAHSIPNYQLFRYVKDCFKMTYKYFGFPRLVDSVLSYEETAVKTLQKEKTGSPVHDDNDNLRVNIEYLSSDEESVSSTNLQDPFEDHDPDISIDSVMGTLSRLSVGSSESDECELESVKVSASVDQDEDDLQQDVIESVSSLDNKSEPQISILKSENSSQVLYSDEDNVSVPASLLTNENKEKAEFHWKTNGITYTKSDMQYYFAKEKIIGDVHPPVICRYCQKQGHLKQNCPDFKLPEIHPLPKMTPEFMFYIDEICEQIMIQNAPGAMETSDRASFLQDLQEFICQEFYEGSHLQMFGSCCNGFGFVNSDMDICLTFDNAKNGENINHTEFIEQLAAVLKKKRTLYNVIAITSAKVPIVKFTVRGNNTLEGDISLYNTLAQHNTKMLHMYSRIDRRVQILGYTMKYFAKVLDICDASRGSLSSYAYILMVLFYLQQINPPVIPVLQELYDGKMPEEIIDGWNAWFYDDCENLLAVWPHLGKNTQSVGELWLGLLCFYTEIFDYKEYVISIRQKEPLSRFKKLWNSKSIAIEDPFDLNHNLGSGLSRKMNLYIIKAFIRARQIFGAPMLAPPSCFADFKDYLFNKEILSEGKNPPNDRGCRACGKIGHIVKDCPRRRANRPSYQRDRANDNYGVREMGPRGVPSHWRENQQGLIKFHKRRQQGTPPRLNLVDKLIQTHSKMPMKPNTHPVNTSCGKSSNMVQGLLPLPLNQVLGMSGYSAQAQNMPFFLHQGMQTANQINQTLEVPPRKPSSNIPPFTGSAVVTRPSFSPKSPSVNPQFSQQHLMKHPHMPSAYRVPVPQHLPSQQSQHIQQQQMHNQLQQGAQQQSLLGMHPQQVQLQHMHQQQTVYPPPPPHNVQQQRHSNPLCYAQEHQKQKFSPVSHMIILPHDSPSKLQVSQSDNSFSTQSHAGIPYPRELVQNK